MIAYDVFGLDPALRASGLALPDGRTALIKTNAKEQDAARLEQIRWTVAAAVDPWPNPIVFAEKMFASQDAAAVLMGVQWVIRTELYRRRIPVVQVSTTKLKQFATGKGRVPGKKSKDRKKYIAEAVAQQTALRFASFDECDAFVLQCIGLEYFGRPHPFGVVSADQRRAIDGLTIEWPTPTGGELAGTQR